MLKKYFKNQKNWKLFIVLQIAGFIGIFVTYTISSNWSPVELTTDYYWGVRHSFTFAQNWIFVFCLSLPFAVAKAIDWMGDD